MFSPRQTCKTALYCIDFRQKVATASERKPLPCQTGRLARRKLRLLSRSKACVGSGLVRSVFWEHYRACLRDAQASLTRKDESLRVTASKVTKRDQDAQVVQYGIHLIEGKWYTVRFRARSPTTRTIRLSCGVFKPL